MKRGYNLIASFVHGNALGVVLEPRGCESLPKEKRKNLWKVCIGPLVSEVALDLEFPEDDFRNVVKDLTKFCKANRVGPLFIHASPVRL